MIPQTNFASFIQGLDSNRQTDPLLSLKSLVIAQNITDPEQRHVRAGALHTLAMNLHRGLCMCDFQNEIVMRPEGIFVRIRPAEIKARVQTRQ